MEWVQIQSDTNQTNDQALLDDLASGSQVQVPFVAARVGEWRRVKRRTESELNVQPRMEAKTKK